MVTYFILMALSPEQTNWGTIEKPSNIKSLLNY